MERIEGTVIATVSSTLDYITVALKYTVLVPHGQFHYYCAIVLR